MSIPLGYSTALLVSVAARPRAVAWKGLSDIRRFATLTRSPPGVVVLARPGLAVIEPAERFEPLNDVLTAWLGCEMRGDCFVVGWDDGKAVDVPAAVVRAFLDLEAA